MAPIVDFRKVAGKKGFYRKSVEILPLFQSDRRRLLPAGQDVETTGGREHRKGVVHDASDSLKQSRFVGQVPNLPHKSWEETSMIRHIVLFRFKTETSQSDRDAFLAMLRAMPSKISEIKSFEAGF